MEQLKREVKYLTKKSKIGWAVYFKTVEEVQEMAMKFKEVLKEEDLSFLKDKHVSLLEMVGKWTDCSVCLCELTKESTKVLNCGHLICKECYTHPQLDKCPECRRKIRK